MKMLSSKLSLIFIIFLAVIIPTSAQNINQSLSSLKGISEMGVIVEKFNTGLEKSGLSEDGIEQQTWDQLNKAGIKILPMTEVQNVPGVPYLYINVGAIKSKGENLYAVSIVVEFRQNVVLSRDIKQNYYGAATWSTSNIGIISGDKLKQIQDFVQESVKRFIDDYKIVNK